MTADEKPGGHRVNGQFAKGNPGGPGGARKRSFVLRQAAENAISPEHIEALMRRALRMGLEGNISAMRLVLDRVCGRTADVSTSAEPLDFVLPPLRSASECNVALERVAAGLCQGTLNLDTARVLVDLIAARIKAIEATALEQRLAELEKTLAVVNPTSHRRF